MKCAECGKEFGDGINCQYCGIDRVTGLGNYSGYHRPAGSTDPLGDYSPSTTVCYACKEIIPANSEYCPYCSKKLYVNCPKCGNYYSSKYPACNQCGTNREQYYKQKETEEERRKLEEKIKKDAAQLKEQLSVIHTNHTNVNNIIGWCLMSIGIVFVFGGFVTLAAEKPDMFVILALVGFLLMIVSAFMFAEGENYKTKEIQRNISQWKNTNPNDPRSNYL